MTAVVAMPTPLGGLGLSTNVQRSAENLPEIFRKAYKAVLDGLDTKYEVRGALYGMWKPQAKRGVKVDDFQQNALDQILEQFDLMSYNDVKSKVDPQGQLTGARVRSEARKRDIYTVDDLTALLEKPYIVRKLLTGESGENSLRVAPIKHRLSRCWTILESLEIVNQSEPIQLSLIDAARKKAAEPTYIDLGQVTTVAVDPLGNAIDPTTDEVDWEKVEFLDLNLKEMLLRGSPVLSVTV
jgi:hypothetical protein